MHHTIRLQVLDFVIQFFQLFLLNEHLRFITFQIDGSQNLYVILIVYLSLNQDLLDIAKFDTLDHSRNYDDDLYSFLILPVHCKKSFSSCSHHRM